MTENSRRERAVRKFFASGGTVTKLPRTRRQPSPYNPCPTLFNGVPISSEGCYWKRGSRFGGVRHMDTAW